MQNKQDAAFLYEAFISYRHMELDTAVAKAIHKKLETYGIPGYIKKKTGKKKMGKVFRDQDELPLLADLGDGIMQALDSSEWLIVICSPDLPQSKWCMAEIDHFIVSGRRDHILTVLISGEPQDSFPPQLRFETLENGETIEREPLAADVRAQTVAGTLRKVRIEKLRLLAPILGVGYDDLKRRQRERFLKTVAAVSAAAAVTAIGAGAYVLNQNAILDKQIILTEEQRQIALQNEQWAISEKNTAQISQSKFLSGLSGDALSAGDIVNARLLALEALPKDLANPERPLIDEAVAALRNASISRSHYGYTLVGSVSAKTHSNWEFFEDANVIRVLDDFYDIATNNLLFSKIPNGRWLEAHNGPRSLLAYSTDDSIYIYDGKQKATRKCFTLGLDSPNSTNNPSFSYLEFSADGKYLVLGYAGYANQIRNYIKLIDVDSGECLKTLTDDDIFPDNAANAFTDKGIKSIAADPNGKYIAYSVSDNDGTQGDLTLIDLNTFEKMRDYTAMPQKRENQDEYYSTLKNIIISPNGEYICATDILDGFQVFSSMTGEFLYRIDPAVSNYTNYAVFSNDSKYLAVYMNTSSVVYDSQTGEKVLESSPDLAPIVWLGFTDEHTLVIRRSTSSNIEFVPVGSGSKYTITIPNIAGGKDVDTLGQDMAVKVGKDSFVCVSSEGVYQLWSKSVDSSMTQTFTITQPDERYITKTFSHDGKRFAVENGTAVEIHSTDLSSPPIIFTQAKYRHTQLIWSPDDSQLLCVDRGGSVRLVETVSGELLHTLEGDNTAATSISRAFPAEDWNCFVFADPNNIGGMYSLLDLSKMWDLPERSLRFEESVVFSADSKTVYFQVPEWSADNKYVSMNQDIHAFDVKTGKSIETQPYRLPYGNPISPDKTKLLVWDASGYDIENETATLVLFDLATKKELWRLECINNIYITWSPDGKHFATAPAYTMVIDVYDAQNGKTLYSFEGDSPNFSPDGQYLSTRKQVSGNSTAQSGYSGVVYDLQTGKSFADLPRHGIFSPDGTTILMQDCIWRIKPIEQLMEDIKCILNGRELTEQERMRFFID